MRQDSRENQASEAQAQALADFLAGRLSNEFSAKCLERAISDREIERVLKSKSSVVASYVDHGQPRYGFWHPESLLFVAWQPPRLGKRGLLKSALEHLDGFDYLRCRPGAEVLRRPTRR